MYLYLGGEAVVKTRDVIGVFDLDSSSVSKETKKYLRACERRGLVQNVSQELPKSFVVTQKKAGRGKKVPRRQCAGSAGAAEGRQYGQAAQRAPGPCTTAGPVPGRGARSAPGPRAAQGEAGGTAGGPGGAAGGPPRAARGGAAGTVYIAQISAATMKKRWGVF